MHECIKKLLFRLHVYGNRGYYQGLEPKQRFLRIEIPSPASMDIALEIDSHSPRGGNGIRSESINLVDIQALAEKLLQCEVDMCTQKELLERDTFTILETAESIRKNFAIYGTL